MKGKDLEKVAEKYVRSLEKYCRRIPGSFTIEDIHDLRVDYKRLRAFIRLCREEPRSRHVQLPDSLREVYRAAGSVRDHQLFLAKITVFTKAQYILPRFTRCIQQQLFKAKEILVKRIEKADWNQIRKYLKSELPPALHDTAIRQFTNRKVAAINILLIAPDREEDLHEVRKNLKDQLHVARVFDTDWAIPFPFPPWKNEKPLSEMAEKLGDFNDECITLSFLNGICQQGIPSEERAHIDEWRNMQVRHIESSKQRLLDEVTRIPLSPAPPRWK